MSKRLGGIIDFDKTSSWHLIGFPEEGSNIRLYCTLTSIAMQVIHGRHETKYHTDPNFKFQHVKKTTRDKET